MSQLYHTAVFIHKPTQKLLYRLSIKPINKYMWEKEKVMVFEKIAKDRFINKHEIEVRDYGTNQPE